MSGEQGHVDTTGSDHTFPVDEPLPWTPHGGMTTDLLDWQRRRRRRQPGPLTPEARAARADCLREYGWDLCTSRY